MMDIGRMRLRVLAAAELSLQTEGPQERKLCKEIQDEEKGREFCKTLKNHRGLWFPFSLL